MKIGIVGSRRRNSGYDFIQVLKMFGAVLNGQELYHKGCSIVSGGCPKGADSFAERIAKDWNIPIEIFPANWERYGKGAGLKRNTQIAEQSDILIACVAEDRKGGTEDTIRKFVKLKGKENLHIV